MDELTHMEFAGGAITLWAEPGGPIMLKAIEGQDPVELGESEAAALYEALGALIRQTRG